MLNLTNSFLEFEIILINTKVKDTNIARFINLFKRSFKKIKIVIIG